MRELILKMSISIDGFVGAGDDAGASWIFETGDPEARAWTLETVSNASLHIMGSRTFREMASFWPFSTHMFAPPMNHIPKAVFTRGGADIAAMAAKIGASTDQPASSAPPPQPGAETWAEAYVAHGDMVDEITKLKAEDGKPIIAHGGAGFARSLTATGLIDRYAFLVHPVALGHGLPIFTDLKTQRRFELVSSTPFPKGSVAQIYRPV